MGSGIGIVVIMVIVFAFAFSMRAKNTKKANEVLASAGNKVEEIKVTGIYAFVDDKGTLFIRLTNRIKVDAIPLNTIEGIEHVYSNKGYHAILIKTEKSGKQYPINKKDIETMVAFIAKHVQASKEA